METSDSFRVPEDYDELSDRYGPYLEELLATNDPAKLNSEELHNFVWLKLLEGDLLTRFSTWACRSRRTEATFRNFFARDVFRHYARYQAIQQSLS